MKIYTYIFAYGVFISIVFLIAGITIYDENNISNFVVYCFLIGILFVINLIGMFHGLYQHCRTPREDVITIDEQRNDTYNQPPPSYQFPSQIPQCYPINIYPSAPSN